MGVGSVVSRNAYRMAADLLEEFLEDSGRHDLHSVDAAGLRLIMGQMQRRASRKHPSDKRADERIEPTRPSRPRPKPQPMPKPKTVVVRVQSRPPASKDETHRLYLEAKERIRRLNQAERDAQRKAYAKRPAIRPNNGTVPPWVG